MRFAHPWFLALFALIPLLAYAYNRIDRRKRGTLRFSDITHLKHAPRSVGMRIRLVVPALRLLVLSLVIVGLARPQYGWKESEVTARGIDIIQALDVSDSMQTRDMGGRISRLEAAKRVIARFVDGRKNDRIGCVVFGKTSFSLCPLTLDYGVLKQFLAGVHKGTVDGSRTAIGMGLANSIRLLNKSKAKSKVIILLTDGVNNAGQVDPFTAAEMAKALGIKIYTIGVGTHGLAYQSGGPFDVWGSLRVARAEYDEDTLRRIAKITNGEFFPATGLKKLADIYKQIDRMEKSEVKTKEYQYYDELIEWAIAPALALLLLEIVLGYTRFRKLP